MNRKPVGNYFALWMAVIAVISVPFKPVESIKGSTVAFMAPFWETLGSFRSFILGNSISLTEEDPICSQQEEIQRLQLENQMLVDEVSRMQELLQHEQLIYSQLCEFPLPMQKASVHHQNEIQFLLNLELQAIPARVIFRSPASWNSSLWINIGESDNETLGCIVIAKNSPVVSGLSLVGVVEYVGQKQSRVRLITDTGLNPSVRAIRGDEGLIEHRKPLYLAKGELRGSNQPHWRTQKPLLHGVGFNYDFADEEGPARDLRTGKVKDEDPHLPLLKIGDLLITTGMDGTFPAGLRVGKVQKVQMLKEGDYYYELEATPTAENLSDISLLFVIPPLGYDSSDKNS